jgi:hypothetical protein
MTEYIPLVMGVISFIGAAATWYGGAVKKNYASERDFGHLKNSYDNLNRNIEQLDRMFDQRLDQIEREQLKTTALIQAMIVRVAGTGSQILNREE